MIHNKKEKSEIGANVLRTGVRFVAKTILGGEQEYAFVGFDLDDVIDGIGCRYIVLQNLTDMTYVYVEAAWFCTALTGREITLVESA